VAFTNASVASLWAAATAGLGITLRTSICMPKSVSVLDPATFGLPTLASIPLCLHRAENEPSVAVNRLAEILLDTIHDELGLVRETSVAA
jgi:DNA-binding transcriptional LysR family regulator